MRVLVFGINGSDYRIENFKKVFKSDLDIEVLEPLLEKYPENCSILKKICLRIINGISMILPLFRSDFVYIPPMTQNCIKIFFAKLLRKKVWTDFYVSLYDMAVNDRKLCSKTSFRAKVYLKRDCYALKNSDVVIFLNEAEKNYYLNVTGNSNAKINSVIIPLAISQKQKAKLPYFNGKSDVLNLCWTGTFIPLQGLNKILYAAKILKERKIKFRFYIIGPDNKNKNMYKEIKKVLGLENEVCFLKIWGNMNNWIKFVSNKCDISLGIFGDSGKAKTVIANKVIDGIAFKTPVITAYSTGIDLYFNGNEDLFLVKNTPEALAEKIIEVANTNNISIEKHIENSYKIYDENFSYQSFRKKTEECFRRQF
mgnify:CR=1 FL=1